MRKHIFSIQVHSCIHKTNFRYKKILFLFCILGNQLSFAQEQYIHPDSLEKWTSNDIINEVYSSNLIIHLFKSFSEHYKLHSVLEVNPVQHDLMLPVLDKIERGEYIPKSLQEVMLMSGYDFVTGMTRIASEDKLFIDDAYFPKLNRQQLIKYRQLQKNKFGIEGITDQIFNHLDGSKDTMSERWLRILNGSRDMSNEKILEVVRALKERKTRSLIVKPLLWNGFEIRLTQLPYKNPQILSIKKIGISEPTELTERIHLYLDYFIQEIYQKHRRLLLKQNLAHKP